MIIRVKSGWDRWPNILSLVCLVRFRFVIWWQTCNLHPLSLYILSSYFKTEQNMEGYGGLERKCMLLLHTGLQGHFVKELKVVCNVPPTSNIHPWYQFMQPNSSWSTEYFSVWCGGKNISADIYSQTPPWPGIYVSIFWADFLYEHTHTNQNRFRIGRDAMLVIRSRGSNWNLSV